MKLTRNQKDNVLKTVITFISSIGLFVLIAILVYIFSQGTSLLSWHLLTGDYYSTNYDIYYDTPLDSTTFERPITLSSDAYFSTKWGIALEDKLDAEGKEYIEIVYVAEDSVLRNAPDKNVEDTYVEIKEGQVLNKVIFTNNTIAISSYGAEQVIDLFDQADGIKDMLTMTIGKGIRGSIITTFYLIILTLLIALPVGVLSAIYLHEYAPKNSKFVNLIRRLVEMLTGVPSIIFGLLGAAVFIPFTMGLTGAAGGNLYSGALTLAVIVLPVIISSTEEALKVIPDDFRHASLALGATKTQTTFKVVLKNAIPGILSATLLSIGRIIGESAALIFAIGVVIRDNIVLTERSTSLAVHIWTIMGGETPNFELASAISIIILAVVFLMNLVVKLIAKKLSY